jgi:hypothetical protein
MRKRLKYRNIPITVNGIKFDSKAEYKRFVELESLQKAGKISNLQMQKDFELQPSFQDNQGEKRRSIKYIADFVYKENGAVIVEDLKSKITAEDSTYIIKKKMLLWLFTREEEYANYQFKEVIK